jgi:hypothetical protein
MRKILLVLSLVLALGLMTACGKSQEQTAGKNLEGAKSVVGTIDEVAADYFSIQTETGTYYQFPFTKENSIDLSNASIGDKIKLYYEGELSDIDMFDGVLIGSEMVE